MATSQYAETLKKLGLDPMAESEDGPIVLSLLDALHVELSKPLRRFHIERFGRNVMIFVWDELGGLWVGESNVGSQLLELGFNAFGIDDCESRSDSHRMHMN